MEPPAKTVRIVIVSDTHNGYPQLPQGDIFIHCGDMTSRGTLKEIEAACGYIKSLPFKHKIVIAGNHDICLDGKNYDRLQKKFQVKDGEAEKARQLLKSVCTYLEHEYTEVEGIKFFGSPFVPEIDNWAFMYNAEEAKHIWDIGNNPVDILITHGPPFGILDQVKGKGGVGCKELLELTHRLRPKYHLFGHIHEGFGSITGEHTTYKNCASKNLFYKLVNPPIVIDYPV